MGFKSFSFFCPVLGGPPEEDPETGCVLSAAIRLLGLVGSPFESGVSPPT